MATPPDGRGSWRGDQARVATPPLRSGFRSNFIERPLCSHCVNHSLLPQREPQRGALQTFLQRRKSGRSSLAPQPAPTGLWRSNRPAFLPEVRLRGITHKAESNSHCLGRETVVLVRWTFLPVTTFIVRGVSSEGWKRARQFSRSCSNGCRLRWRSTSGRASGYGPKLNLPRGGSPSERPETARGCLVPGTPPPIRKRPPPQHLTISRQCGRDGCLDPDPCVRTLVVCEAFEHP